MKFGTKKDRFTVSKILKATYVDIFFKLVLSNMSSPKGLAVKNTQSRKQWLLFEGAVSLHKVHLLLSQ